VYEPSPAVADPVAAMRERVDELGGEDRSRWAGPARAARVVELVELCDRLQAEVARAVGDWDRDAAWVADGALSAVSWLAGHTPLGESAAARQVRTARFARDHEATGRALACRRVPYAQVEILAALAQRREQAYVEGEEFLLESAARFRPAEFTRLARRWRTVVDDLDDAQGPSRAHERRYLHASTTLYGTVRGDFELDAEGGKVFLEALDARTTPDAADGPEPPRSLAQRRADALVDLASEALALDQTGTSEGPSRRPSTGLDALVDIGTLTGDADPASTRAELPGIGPIPGETALRIACDAAVGRIVMRGPSEVLDVGRRSRVVPRALRRALVVRDGGCVFPECRRPAQWCDVHHCVPWSMGGSTDLANCVLLCRRHHVLCHEGGWRIRRGPDGRVEVESPTGTVTHDDRRSPPARE
jgi:hypothetical protein